MELQVYAIIYRPLGSLKRPSIHSPLACSAGARFVRVKSQERGSKDVYLMLQTELATLRERKSAMLALNVSAHRLITDLGAAATSVSVCLKDAVSDLYSVWDETFQR